VSSLLTCFGAAAAGHTSHRLLRVPPIRLLPLPETVYPVRWFQLPDAIRAASREVPNA